MVPYTIVCNKAADAYTDLLFNVWVSAEFQSPSDFLCQDSVNKLKLPIHQALQYHNTALKTLDSGHLVPFGREKQTQNQKAEGES